MDGDTILIAGGRPALPPSGALAKLRAARIIHPFPTMLNVAATGGLAFIAARGAPAGSVLIRMILLMFCAQSAIGIINDYYDRSLDAVTKPWKPLVAGLLSPRRALAIALALMAVTAALGASLGTASFALATVGLASGLVYDVWLKRTRLSAVPYMVGITTLPLWVWATLGEWQDALWWLLPLGSLIGLALHLANTVPDIEGDRANGVQGMAHRLGAKRSIFVAWGSFGTALAISGALAPVLGYELRVYLPSALAGALCLLASVGLYFRTREASALQFGFGALSVGAIIVAAGWLAALG